jgi:hypothetical protein
MHHVDQLGSRVVRLGSNAGGVAAGSRQAVDKPGTDRIVPPTTASAAGIARSVRRFTR